MTRMKPPLLFIPLVMLGVLLMACSVTLAKDASDTESQVPLHLSPQEAIDMARFRRFKYGTGDMFGVISVPDARETLVAEMTGDEADAFLRSIGQRPLSEWEHNTRPENLLFVVVRGSVDIQSGLYINNTPPKFDGLAMAFPIGSGSTYILGIGPPWDTVTPPNAQSLPVKSGPRLQDVSLARARSEVGGVYQPAYMADGLILSQVNINPVGHAVDASGATFERTSVSLIYSNAESEASLVLSQSSFLGNPTVAGSASPLAIGTNPGMIYDVGPCIESLAWSAGDRYFLLTSLQGKQVTRDQLRRIAESFTVKTPRPIVPATAEPVPTAEPRQTSAPKPAPPMGDGPIPGELVGLQLARERTPYTIPLPVKTNGSANLVEVWVSYENTPPEYRQVFLIYSNGLKISIGGRPEPVDYSSPEFAAPPFRVADVNGIPASGKNPAMKELNDGTIVNTPANISWWVNRVDIALYHPRFSMEQLLEVAESMPKPEWK